MTAGGQVNSTSVCGAGSGEGGGEGVGGAALKAAALEAGLNRYATLAHTCISDASLPVTAAKVSCCTISAHL